MNFLSCRRLAFCRNFVRNNMFKIIRSIELIAVVLAVTLLCACSKEESNYSLVEASVSETNYFVESNPTGEYSKGITNDYPSCFNAKIDRCTFSIGELNYPKETTIFSGVACNNNADYLGLAKELVSGEKYTVDQDTGDLYVIESESKDFVKYKYYVGTKGTINFIDYSIPYYNSVILDYENPYFNLNAYTSERVFSFGTPEKCFEDVAGLFERYGLDIKNNVIVETYYLDHEILANEEIAYNKDGIIDSSKKRPSGWSEHDDAYMFFINQTCQELPDSFHSSFLWAGWYSPVSNAGLVIIYNEKGIALIEPRRQICTYKLNTETVQLLSFDKMANCVAEHLNGFVDDSTKYQITNAKLYVAHEYSRNFVDVPLEYHWVFLVTETNNSQTKSYEICFNAVTGEYEEY